MPSVGVVLGAGGIVGAAYHAGVLTALAEAGFDARRATILAGTSAGSGVAATVRAGFPPIDLAARALGRPISREAALLVGKMTGPPTIEFRPRPPSRPPLPSSPGLLFRARRPATAIAGLLPSGSVPTEEIGARIDALYGDRTWPARPLWICAVDLDTGERVVFGRDDIAARVITETVIEARVGVAVQASSAIPGFFRPVEHGGRRFVDGGVHSPTNADLLAAAGLDLVVVVSPMSVTASGSGPRPFSARPLHSFRLASEVAHLRRSGTDVLTFQPTPADAALMGRNGMDAGRRAATAEMALATARSRLADAQVADRLRVLRAASAGP